MKQLNRTRAFFTLFLALLLTACNNQPSKPDTPAPDIFEIEQLANAAYEINDWLESEKHYAELVRRIPENAVHWFRLGNVYTRTQRPDAAIVAYREALVRDPRMAKAWYNMGVLQLKQAANSFEQLGVYSDNKDVLYPQSQELLDGIIELMQGKQEKSSAEEQLMKAFRPGKSIELIEEDKGE